MKKDVLDTNNDGVVDGQELASGKWRDCLCGEGGLRCWGLGFRVEDL